MHAAITTLPPILLAARIGDVQALHQLLQHGSDVNTTDEDGNTALHEVALRGHAEVIELHLDRRASPVLRNRFGRVPMELARESHIRELLRAGSRGT